MADETGWRTVGKLRYPSKHFGSGSFGFVFVGYYGRKKVAVKRILKDNLDYNRESLMPSEAELMQTADDHPNILRYICTEQDDNFMYIATEWCAGTLGDYVKGDYEGPKIGDEREVLRQITQGLAYLHRIKIVHRDIKPNNILIWVPSIDNAEDLLKPKVKLADFGLSKLWKADDQGFSTRSNPHGAEGWMAPELIRPIQEEHCWRRCYHFSVDIFPLGCVFGYVLSEGGKHPFGSNSIEQSSRIFNGESMVLTSSDLKAPYNQDDIAIQLIQHMVQMEPEKRFGANEVLSHVFFDACQNLPRKTEPSDGLKADAVLLEHTCFGDDSASQLMKTAEENKESNWRRGHYNLQRIDCCSENLKGVYCLQYDDQRIVSGHRSQEIRIWDRQSVQCTKVLTGHTDSVLCLQFDEFVIISGSMDKTVRVWDLKSGEMVNTIVHHCEKVLHLRFAHRLLVTCSLDKSIAVWNLISPTEINLCRVLLGHTAAINAVDFDDKFIVSASGDKSIKVWSTTTFELVRTLIGHKRGIACLQYKDELIVSGSSDTTIRLWDITSGVCIRVLEGHKKLVRCIKFDSKRILSGSYDGKIKVWDLKAALDPRAPEGTLCLQTLTEHTGKVFRIQFDEFKMMSSSQDDTILIWDFIS